jgi:hypothetical protein
MKYVQREVPPIQLAQINCWYCKIQRLNNGCRCMCGAYENHDIGPVLPDRVCRFCMVPRGKREGTTLNCASCNASPVLTNRTFMPPTKDGQTRESRELPRERPKVYKQAVGRSVSQIDVQ